MVTTTSAGKESRERPRGSEDANGEEGEEGEVEDGADAAGGALP